MRRANCPEPKSSAMILIDDAHNCYMCPKCKHIAYFMVGGPIETGWSECPYCKFSLIHKERFHEQTSKAR